MNKYANEVMEAKRLSALKLLGSRWLVHPANRVQRKDGKVYGQHPEKVTQIRRRRKE